MANRANGEGTISPRRKNGKIVGWKGAAVVGHKPDGSEDRRWVSGKTQADVREKLEEIKTARNGGMLSASGSMTFGEFLDTWLEHIKSTGKAQNTLADYTYTVQHIKNVLSKKRLDKLAVLDIEKVVKTVGENISSSAARRVLSRTRQALGQAVRWQLIPRNVAQIVEVPKVPKRSWTAWEALDTAKFLEHAKMHRLYALFYLGLTTGMRSAELRGLRWQDLDFEGGWVNITHNALTDRKGRSTLSKTTKTDKSARRIRVGKGIMHVLLEHQNRQKLQQEYIENPRPALERRRERQGVEVAYTEQKLVFCSELGTLLGDRNLRREFTQLVGTAKVPKIRIHDMRHTAASAMIRRGYPAKLVADILGHTDPGFTLRTYTHVWGEQREEFALSAENLYGFDVPVPALN